MLVSTYAARLIEAGDLPSSLVAWLSSLMRISVRPIQMRRFIPWCYKQLSYRLSSWGLHSHRQHRQWSSLPKSNSAYVAMDKALVDLEVLATFLFPRHLSKDGHYAGSKNWEMRKTINTSQLLLATGSIVPLARQAQTRPYFIPNENGKYERALEPPRRRLINLRKVTSVVPRFSLAKMWYHIHRNAVVYDFTYVDRLFFVLLKTKTWQYVAVSRGSS